MKATRCFIAIVSLALTTPFARAQIGQYARSLDEFVGLRWGAGVEDVKSIMGGKGANYRDTLDGGSHLF